MVMNVTILVPLTVYLVYQIHTVPSVKKTHITDHIVRKNVHTVATKVRVV
jgi:hypothetical protein